MVSEHIGRGIAIETQYCVLIVRHEPGKYIGNSEQYSRAYIPFASFADQCHVIKYQCKSLFNNKCEREGGHSLSDFGIVMRECGRSHSTEEQSQKRQRGAGAMVFFEYFKLIRYNFKISSDFASFERLSSFVSVAYPKYAPSTAG